MLWEEVEDESKMRKEEVSIDFYLVTRFSGTLSAPARNSCLWDDMAELQQPRLWRSEEVVVDGSCLKHGSFETCCRWCSCQVQDESQMRNEEAPAIASHDCRTGAGAPLQCSLPNAATQLARAKNKENLRLVLS
eukprot:s1290_g11.t2